MTRSHFYSEVLKSYDQFVIKQDCVVIATNGLHKTTNPSEIHIFLFGSVRTYCSVFDNRV